MAWKTAYPTRLRWATDELVRRRQWDDIEAIRERADHYYLATKDLQEAAQEAGKALLVREAKRGESDDTQPTL
jgi:adenylate kinase family enzyme